MYNLPSASSKRKEIRYGLIALLIIVIIGAVPLFMGSTSLFKGSLGDIEEAQMNEDNCTNNGGEWIAPQAPAAQQPAQPAAAAAGGADVIAAAQANDAQSEGKCKFDGRVIKTVKDLKTASALKTACDQIAPRGAGFSWENDEPICTFARKTYTTAKALSAGVNEYDRFIQTCTEANGVFSGISCAVEGGVVESLADLDLKLLSIQCAKIGGNFSDINKQCVHTIGTISSFLELKTKWMQFLCARAKEAADSAAVQTTVRFEQAQLACVYGNQTYTYSNYLTLQTIISCLKNGGTFDSATSTCNFADNLAKLKTICAYAYSNAGVGKWVEDAADPTKNKCTIYNSYVKYFDRTPDRPDLFQNDIGLLTAGIKKVEEERAAYREQCLKEKGTWPSTSYCLYNNKIIYDYKAFVAEVTALSQKSAAERAQMEKETGLTEQIKTLEMTAAEEKLAKQRDKETAEAIKKATEQAEAATKLAQEEARKATAEQEKAVAAAKASAEKEAREAEKARAEADRLTKEAAMWKERAANDKASQEAVIKAEREAAAARTEAEKAKYEATAAQTKAEAEKAKQESAIAQSKIELELIKTQQAAAVAAAKSQAAAQPTVIAPVALPAPTYAETPAAPTVIIPEIQCPDKFLYDTKNKVCVESTVAAKPAAKKKTTTAKKPAAPTAPDMTGQLSQDQMNKLLMQLLLQMMTQNAAK